MSSDLLMDPARIAGEIESQPPLMRKEAASAYCGKEVDWFLIYRNGYEVSSGRVQLLFAHGVGHTPMVTGTVTFSEYPQLRHLRAGETVRVRGTICSIDTLQVVLDIRELVLPKVATHQGTL